MKKRKDCFWGLHFDFHAQPKDGIQGQDLREEDIREICRSLKPDFLQIDCKGHPGWTSYPSALGNALPSFAEDPLRLWRRVTQEEGISLYMHYSGVYDRKYCSEHPEERVKMADGTLHPWAAKPGGSYVDDLLIPQLLELAGEYGVDGVWVDGDCWMALADYSTETLSAFEEETGIDLQGRAPVTPEDAHYDAFREYNRELFRRYMRRYVDAVHEKYPDFEVCSNWAFSDHMPERVSVNVDFLSGDLNPINSFHSARYAARALAQQEGYAWDLMSWNFRNSVGGRAAYAAKHPNQLMQEAAAVIAVGGAYQNYVPQNRDGTPRMWELKNLKTLSEFVLARKPYCHRGTPIPQVGLLLSTYDRHHEAQHLYSRTGYEKVMGLTALLCDAGQSLEILCEHTLEKKMDAYPVIVVPELYDGLEDTVLKSLLSYAQAGGNLILVGKKTCSLFAAAGAPIQCILSGELADDALGSSENGHNNVVTNVYEPYCFTADGNTFGALFSPCEITAKDAKINAFFAKNPTDSQKPLSVTVPYGEGSLTAIGFDVGSQYLAAAQYLHRKLVKEIIEDLYDPIARVDAACGRLELVALRKDGKLFVQLVNAGGSHGDPSSATDDYIPPVLDIQLSLSLPNSPRRILLQPEGKEIPFTRGDDGRVSLHLARIDVHSILEIVDEEEDEL